MDSIFNLENQLIDELSKFDIQLNTRREDSLYNSIRLVSDEGYAEFINAIYEPYSIARFAFIEARNHLTAQKELLISYEKVNILYRKQEKRRLKFDGELTSTKNELQSLKSRVHSDLMLSEDLNGLILMVEAKESVSLMLNNQLAYLKKLLRLYEDHLLVNQRSTNSKIDTGNIVYNPSLFQTKISWLKDYGKFVQLFHLLEKFGHISNLTNDMFSTLLSLYIFPNEVITSNLIERKSNSLGLINGNSKIKWNSKNVDFSLVYWWLINKGFTEMHREKTLTPIVNIFWGIFEFAESKPDTKYPQDSLRKSISGIENSKSIKSKIQNSSITDILKPMLPLE